MVCCLFLLLSGSAFLRCVIYPHLPSSVLAVMHGCFLAVKLSPVCGYGNFRVSMCVSGLLEKKQREGKGRLIKGPPSHGGPETTAGRAWPGPWEVATKSSLHVSGAHSAFGACPTLSFHPLPHLLCLAPVTHPTGIRLPQKPRKTLFLFVLCCNSKENLYKYSLAWLCSIMPAFSTKVSPRFGSAFHLRG